MNDSLGDRMKLFEGLTESTLMPYLPILARIDGRAFHTLTRSCKKPYDEEFAEAMQYTAIHLVESFDPLLSYVQSDEISLLFYQKTFLSQMPFGGRVQKLCSVLASAAAVKFNKVFGSDYETFDCRVWQVPNKEEVFNYFIWRERDATRNSILGAADSLLGHKACQGKNTSELQEMMFQKGVNWNDYAAHFKRGTYFRKETRLVESSYYMNLSTSTGFGPPHSGDRLEKPMVPRSFVQGLDLQLSKVLNKEEVIFDGKPPNYETGS